MAGTMALTKAAERKYKRRDDSRLNDVTDEEWALIEPLIPKQDRMGRPRKTDLRDVFNAIQFMLPSGCQWRLVPERYPPLTPRCKSSKNRATGSLVASGRTNGTRKLVSK